MKKLFYFPIYIIMLLLLPACDKFHDKIQPADNLPIGAVYQTVADLETALNGIYNTLQSQSLGGLVIFKVPELMSGNGSFTVGGYPETIDIANRNLRSSNLYITGFWTEAYKAINLANAVLGALETVRDASLTPELHNRIKGEALFIRGYLYFELLRYFGQPYGDTSAENGIPVVTDAVLQKADLSFPFRANLEQSYEQAIEDISTAETLLPTSQPRDRANPQAAKSMLARIAFQKGDYPLAASLSKSIIEHPDYGLTATAKEFFTNESSPEVIWSIAFSPSDPSSMAFWFHSSANLIHISDDLKLAFESVATAAQKTAVANQGLFIMDQRSTAGLLVSADTSNTNKYEDVSGRADDAPMARLAEFILMRAEALARNNEFQPAIDLLNQIRARSLRVVNANGEEQPAMQDLVLFKLSDFPGDTDELIDAIVLERQVELCFEGNYFQDMIRLHRDIQGLPYDDCRLRLPIPQREIDVNKNLKQNEPCY